MTYALAARRTWWAKLERADRHVAEFEAKFERLQQERIPYVVTTQPYEFNTGTMLEARAEPPEVYRDDMAAVVGDIVFNARSALDHICVALSGNDRSQYPIFETDPWAVSEDLEVERINAGHRQDFKGYTKGMPARAIELIRESQPYVLESFPPPWLHPLAILKRLSNADKHRRFVALVDCICNVEVTCTFDGVKVPNHFAPTSWAGSGAVVGIVPLPETGVDVNVQASGGTHLTLREPQPPEIQHEVPDSLRNLVHYVRRAVVEQLDPLVL